MGKQPRPCGGGDGLQAGVPGFHQTDAAHCAGMAVDPLTANSWHSGRAPQAEWSLTFEESMDIDPAHLAGGSGHL